MSGPGHFVSRPDFSTLHQQLAKRASAPSFAEPAAPAASDTDGGAQTSPRRRYRENSPSPSEDGRGAEAEGNGARVRKRKSVTFGQNLQQFIPSRAMSTYDALERDAMDSTPGPLKPSRPRKLGTFDGVYVPVCLNLIGVVLLLRFGFILGQAGLIGSLGLLVVSYFIDIFTAFSLSAIASNGQVRGGGAYYLISRSLGPEFGGAIGVTFFMAQAFNAALNILGFVESITTNFGATPENPSGFLPLGPWMSFFYASSVLLFCALVCMSGASTFARLASIMAVIVTVSIASILLSFLFKHPFIDATRHIVYTGPSLSTLRGNLFPFFTHGAAGSSVPKDSYNSIFAVLFPACNGFLAGASLSGELRKPSKSIAKGTIWALESVFVIYVVVLLGMAATIKRETFYYDLAILADASIFRPIVVCGILVSTLFSTLMGMTACGQILQAVARDNLIPILAPFRQGTEGRDDPVYASLLTYVVCQITLLSDSVNNIASLVSMATLLVFTSINLACFTLRVGGSPNFRPSFRLFSEWTALAGMLLAFAAMYFVDPVAASTALIVFVVLFSVIHYSSPPKQWGEVTQSLIYHQVRKYLLRLDERKHNVKYWRPQILLFTNDPRKDWNSIIFCNSLKKGGLYVLGHVLKGEFGSAIEELQLQQMGWLRLIDISGVKAFVDLTVAPDERVGCRNLLLASGLGGMRPNICILGFPDSAQRRRRAREVRRASTASSLSDSGSDATVRAEVEAEVEPDSLGELPTDSQRSETPINVMCFVGIIEDALLLKKAVGLAYGFRSLRTPPPKSAAPSPAAGPQKDEKRWIDLWPILPEGDSAWETYTMVLQLGTILSFAPSWKKTHALRVNIFCERWEVPEERRRMQQLLDNLRISATLRVCVLNDGSVKSYDCLVNGSEEGRARVDEALGGDPWWEALSFMRKDAAERASAASMSDSPRPYRHSESSRSRPDFNKLSRSAREHNMRIKAVHPHSHGDEDDSDIEDSDDDYEDDDDAARAAYRRTRAMSLRLEEGLPDEPRRPLLAARQRHYGSSDTRARATAASSLADELAISPDTVAEHSPATAAQAPVIAPRFNHPSGSRASSLRNPSGAGVPDAQPILPSLEFNSLPIRAQFVCLNELIALHSGDDTAIIFTSLPAPDPGTADTYERSSRYLEHLDTFFAGLPPVLAINGRQMSVTTSL